MLDRDMRPQQSGARPWMMAAAAGALSALMFMASAGGSALLVLVSFFMPLPIFAVGFVHGPALALAAGGAASAITALSFGLAPAIVFAALYALPPVWLVKQALQWRMPEGGTGPEDAEWYPAGNLMGWIAGLAAAALIGVMLLFAGTPGGLAGGIETGLGRLMPDTAPLTDALAQAGMPMSREEFLGVVAQILPAAAAVIWVLMMTVGGILGLRSANLIGGAMRPPLDIRSAQLPLGLSAGLALALIASLLGGGIGFAGGTLSVVFAVPFFLMGLVTVHVLTARWMVPSAGSQAEGDAPPQLWSGVRTLFLAVFYVLVMVQAALILLVTVVGLVDQWAGLRRRVLAAPGSGDDDPGKENG